MLMAFSERVGELVHLLVVEFTQWPRTLRPRVAATDPTSGLTPEHAPYCSHTCDLLCRLQVTFLTSMTLTCFFCGLLQFHLILLPGDHCCY
jgi:hypothetical protein